MSAASDTIESQIDVWRAFVTGRAAISSDDVDELEGHLRDRIDELEHKGLDPDEAFLIAVKRIGRLDEVSREFAREHSDRLWKQLVIGDRSDSGSHGRSVTLAVVVAVIAALWVKLPWLAGAQEWTLVTVGPMFFLSPLAVYLLIRRRASILAAAATLLPFAIAAALLLAYPFSEPRMTHILAFLHSIVALWLAVGIAYTGGRVRSGPARMDFIRFTGEWVVYVGLILIGGGILTGIATAAFAMVGIDVSELAVTWAAPCGAGAAIVIGAWLVEEKQNVIENIAPVLTRLFTPLFTVVLIALVIAAVMQRDLIDGSRELLIVFDVVLVAALALLLYTMSARRPDKLAGWFEALQLGMVVSALIVDGIVLVAMLARIGEYGVSANKLASFGVNVILLVNLVGAAWGLVRFLSGRGGFAPLERWQTSYVPVYLVWAVVVVVVFPPLFGFT